jgi:hypothetical protein
VTAPGVEQCDGCTYWLAGWCRRFPAFVARAAADWCGEFVAGTAPPPTPEPGPATLPERGPFTFPAPYNTTGVRLTNGSDMGGQDALIPTGYAYWNCINAHAGRPVLHVMLAIRGQGPCLYQVDKATLTVHPLGPIFAPAHSLASATGEGWYWSLTDPDILYASDLEHLYRYHVSTTELETVIDVREIPSRTEEILWQWHTAADDRTHSATVKAGESGDWKPIGTIVFREGSPWAWYPRLGDLDESQISKSGAWLLIKEQLDAQGGEDNRIIRVADNHERRILDPEGAAGHSDNGYNYMVAADNYHDQPAAWRVWAFDESMGPQGRLVDTRPWEVQIQHVSHCNARPEGGPDGQWVLGSGAARSGSAAGNELVLIPLDGSLRSRAIAPTMVNLDSPGGGTDDYSKLPRANLDPHGEYALWTSNHGSDRLDAFLVKIPPL